MSKLITLLGFVIVFCIGLTNLINASLLLAHASNLGKLGRRMTKVIGCGLFGMFEALVCNRCFPMTDEEAERVQYP